LVASESFAGANPTASGVDRGSESDPAILTAIAIDKPASIKPW
jgi:hypothetical protein